MAGDLVGGARVGSLGDDDVALLEKYRRDRNSSVEQAAGVVPEIDDQGLDPLPEQSCHCLFELLVGSVGEEIQPHVARIPHGFALHDRNHHRFPGNGHGDPNSLANYLQRNIAPRRATDSCGHLVDGPAFDIPAIDSNDHVTRLDPGSLSPGCRRWWR